MGDRAMKNTTTTKSAQRFTRSMIKNFGRAQSREILQILDTLLENNDSSDFDESMRALFTEALSILNNTRYERITEEQLNNKDWRAEQIKKPHNNK